MAAITADGRQELVALYLTMFGRAPTTVQLAQMVVARENGSTLAQVATTLAVESDFALIAAKDADSFATYLADALMATDIPASARAWAINWVVTQVQGTKTKAQVIAEAVQAIRATGNTNYSSSQAELAADVTSALTAIDNPSDSRLVALAQSYGVALDAFKSFISANVDHLAVCYAYVDQFGINFTNLLDLLQYKDESGLRKSLLEHGLDVTQLGIKKPAALGYSSNSTKLTTGAETYSGTDGKDSLDALAGDDVVNGLAGNDLIYGGAGNDVLTGSGQADVISGGAGADVITGGVGADIHTGGAGADTFVFAVLDTFGADGAAVADVITDFVVGTDKLQFNAIADIVSAQQAAVQTAVTALAATSTDAQVATAMALANTTSLGVSFAVFGGNTYVYVETAGATATHDADANIFIKLTGVTTAPTFAADVVAGV